MRERRPIAGRMPRSLFGRPGIQPPPQPGAAHANADAGTPAVGDPDDDLLWDDGQQMLWDDSQPIDWDK